MSKVTLLEITNDTSSRVKLKCRRSYTITNSMGFILKSYKKGEIHPRNEIFLRPGHWKIVSQKEQNKKSKTIYKI